MGGGEPVEADGAEVRFEPVVDDPPVLVDGGLGDPGVGEDVINPSVEVTSDGEGAVGRDPSGDLALEVAECG